MSESAKRGWVLGASLAWGALFGLGLFRLRHSFDEFYQSSRRTEALTQALAVESRRIEDSARYIQERSSEIVFLQNLVTLLPQSKSFIRTQRAMADEVEILRSKVGRRVKSDLHVLVDTRANKLYVKKGLTLLWEADCSVGKGGQLTDKLTGRRWEFVTPKGQFDIRDKIEKPLWIKPDWAFVETGEAIPPPGDPLRKVEGELGAYVMNLGDGYLIHGTRNEAALGRPVSHGCVRLGAVDLQKLYELVAPKTRVYIY